MKTSPRLTVAECPPARVITSPTENTESYTLRHRHRPWVAHQKLVVASFLGDAAMVFLMLMLAYHIRFETGVRGLGVEDTAVDLRGYLGHVVLGGALLVFMLANFRLHDPRNFLAIRTTIRLIVKTCLTWGVGFLALALVLKIEPAISRVYCAVGTACAMSGLLAWRWVLYCVLRRDACADSLRQKAVFVGWNDECARAVARFGDGRSHQISVSGIITPPGGGLDVEPGSEVPVLGSYEGLRPILRSSGADVVMVVDGTLSRHQMLELAETCGREFIDFKLVPSCFQILVSGLQLESLHGMPVLGIGKMPLHHAFNNAAKRALDIIGGLFGLILFGPLMAIFALLVYLESPGPVIYRQRRIGLNGRPFDIFKIRSMKPDAEAAGVPGWTVKDDPRRLRIGAFMREWNIDELPQFWNVLRGEMSLVGPRPERPELIEGFKEEIPHYNVRHNIKPGVTGWAQVHGLRGDTCLKERVKFDLDYIENWNFGLDLQIMMMTLYKKERRMLRTATSHRSGITGRMEVSSDALASHAAIRNRSIRAAVVTSFLSKAGTVMLQLLSIPIAVRVLGREEFGLYTTVNLTLSTISLLQVGVGPALTHGLSRARAAGDEVRQRELGSTAFFLMAGIALVTALALAGVLFLVPLPLIYGEAFAGKTGVLRTALWTGLGLFLMLFVLNLTERIREGHLEVAANNIWGAVGNVLAALFVGAGVWWIPEVWFLVVAVHGSMVIAKLLNTVSLWRKHPLMVPRLEFFRISVARGLSSDGMAFSTCCLVTGLVEYNFCGWMVGRIGGPSALALYGVFISITVMQLGFVIMLTMPTWPAVAEALARGDLPWARKASGRVYRFGSAFALCSALGLVLIGPWVMSLWLGKDFGEIGRPVLACYGLYFAVHVWRHLNHAMMIGTGQVSKLVGIQLLESAVVACVAWFALKQGGTGAMLASMGVVILSLTGTFLPRRVARVLGRGPG